MGDTISTPATVDMGVIDSIYTTAMNNNFLPDIGIIEPLQKCSFGNSEELLQQQIRKKMDEANSAHKLPEYVKDLGQALGPMTRMPNAVGMGAVVISIILNLLIPSPDDKKDDDVYTQVRKAFNDEKSEAIYVTIDTYAQQYRHYIHSRRQLLRISTNAMDQISREVNGLRRELMRSMRTDYLKSWANGAALHVLLMAHIANMNQTSENQGAARIAVIDYQRELNQLLVKFKEYARSELFRFKRTNIIPAFGACCGHSECNLHNLELKTHIELECPQRRGLIREEQRFGLSIDIFNAEYTDALTDRMFSAPNWVTALKAYFSDLKSNLDTLMTEQGVFRTPTCTELQQIYPQLPSDCY